MNVVERLSGKEKKHAVYSLPQMHHLPEGKKFPAMSEEEQFRLLATNGMLVKRPLIVDKDKVLVGFKEAEWEEYLR